MTIWHNLVGLLISIGAVAFGRCLLANARRMADATIDYETSFLQLPVDWGSERSRKEETIWNKAGAWIVIISSAAMGLACAAQLAFRLFS